MSAKDTVVVGGEPRIDFLPPEIKRKKQGRRRIRGLILLIAAVAVLCVGAYAGISGVAIANQALLATEQDRTLALLAQQGQFSEARSAAQTVETAQSARLVASAPEILWREQLAALQSTLPEGAAITQLVVTSQSATSPGVSADGVQTQALSSLLTVSATFPSVDAVALWLDTLPLLPGFATAWASPIADAEGLYEVQATIGLDREAFAARFLQPDESAESAESTESATGEDGN
jgi:Tfp pilus assembly protein PilN